jgi:hypothetical protein
MRIPGPADRLPRRQEELVRPEIAVPGVRRPPALVRPDARRLGEPPSGRMPPLRHRRPGGEDEDEGDRSRRDDGQDSDRSTSGEIAWFTLTLRSDALQRFESARRLEPAPLSRSPWRPTKLLDCEPLRPRSAPSGRRPRRPRSARTGRSSCARRRGRAGSRGRRRRARGGARSRERVPGGVRVAVRDAGLVEAAAPPARERAFADRLVAQTLRRDGVRVDPVEDVVARGRALRAARGRRAARRRALMRDDPVLAALPVDHLHVAGGGRAVAKLDVLGSARRRPASKRRRAGRRRRRRARAARRPRRL